MAMTPILRRLSFGLAAAVLLTGVVPAVHEFGHWLPGVIAGAGVRETTWTLWGGGSPHVTFAAAPESAMPWIDAGGVLLPTVLGIALLLTWAHGSPARRSPGWLLLLVVGVGLACNSWGAVIEAFAPATSYSHLRALAHRLGYDGGEGVALQSIPALAAAAALCHALRRARTRRRETARGADSAARMNVTSAVPDPTPPDPPRPLPQSDECGGDGSGTRVRRESGDGGRGAGGSSHGTGGGGGRAVGPGG